MKERASDRSSGKKSKASDPTPGKEDVRLARFIGADRVDGAGSHGRTESTSRPRTMGQAYRADEAGSHDSVDGPDSIDRAGSSGGVEASSDSLLKALSTYKAQVKYRVDASGSEVMHRMRSQVLQGSGSISKGKTRTGRGLYLARPSASVWMAAAVVLLTLFGTWVVWQQRGSTHEAVVWVADSAQQRVAHALASGSTATLRPHSSLEQIVRTHSEERYRVQGEVYFEVSADDQRSFLVELAGAVVRVTGTRFVVRSSGETSAVFVEQGSVRFESADGTQGYSLSSGMASEFIDGLMGEPVRFSPESALAWLRDELVMDNRTAADVVEELARHYNVRISLASDLRDEHLGGSLRLDDLSENLQDLAVLLQGRIAERESGWYELLPN